MKFRKMNYSLGAILIISISLTPILYNFHYDLRAHSPNFEAKDDLRISQGKIFDGMYGNYTLDFMESVNNSCFTYTRVSGNLYNVTWVNVGGTSSWIENKLTRITSNASGYYSIRNGRHSFLWLFTNISLGNLTLIAVDGVDNHLFNVSEELTCNYPCVGDIDVWVLQDLFEPSGVAWYEKTTGILINGTFVWHDDNFSLTLTSTNIFEYYQYQDFVLEIPGYNLIVFIPLIVVILLGLLWKIKIKLVKTYF